MASRRTLKPRGCVGVSLLSPLPHIPGPHETTDLVVSRERGDSEISQPAGLRVWGTSPGEDHPGQGWFMAVGIRDGAVGKAASPGP